MNKSPTVILNDDHFTILFYILGIQFLGNEFETLRENIIQSLAKILFGDEVAAEYILLNAISRV